MTFYRKGFVAQRLGTHCVRPGEGKGCGKYRHLLLSDHPRAGCEESFSTAVRSLSAMEKPLRPVCTASYTARSTEASSGLGVLNSMGVGLLFVAWTLSVALRACHT